MLKRIGINMIDMDVSFIRCHYYTAKKDLTQMEIAFLMVFLLMGGEKLCTEQTEALFSVTELPE